MLLSCLTSRSRTPPGLAAAAQHHLCRVALSPATPWPPAWPLTLTLPAGFPISSACRVPPVTWDRLTWAACSEGPLVSLQASTPTIWTWTLTASPPASPLCAWRPKSTAPPYLGPHDALASGGSGEGTAETWDVKTKPARGEEALELKSPKARLPESCDKTDMQWTPLMRAETVGGGTFQRCPMRAVVLMISEGIDN